MISREMTELATLAAVVRKEVPEAFAVYLFGSLAAGRARPDSDLDLAVLAPQAFSASARWEAQERIAAALARPVDLVDLASTSTVLAVQVITRGQVLVDLDPGRRYAFEGRALADYARLNEERSEILERIRREERIHAG